MADLDFSQTYFALFDLPQQFRIDQSALTAQYRQLQRRYHPDRFAAADDAERRAAMQASTFVNEAYETLRSPVRRGQYLLTLADVHSDFDNLTFNDPPFLMKQLALREELAALGDSAKAGQDQEAALADFSDHVNAALEQEQQQFDEHYAAGGFDAALESLAKLQFLQKLADEAEALEGELLDD